MRIYFLILCCIFSVVTAHAACNSNIPASTPDSQLIDNNDGTITDKKTGLMWKKCLEGVKGDNCEAGLPSSFTLQEALQQPGTVNASGGFADYTDWRLPNIRELRSIVEKQCYDPAINLNRFPATPNSYVWSGSPNADSSGLAWFVYFYLGYSYISHRYDDLAVRLVRGGQ